MRLTGFILLSLLGGGGAMAAAATRPITKEALAAALKQGGLPGAELAATIRLAGVAFALTPGDEEELTALGAGAGLLDAVRQTRVASNVRGAGRPLAPVELLLKLYHGSPVTAAAAVKARGAAFALTPAFEAQVIEAGGDQALLGLVTLRRLEIEPHQQIAATPVPAAPVESGPPEAAAATSALKGLRIDPAVQAKKLVKKPEAEFPQLAYRARLSGQVVVEALIGRDGRVRRVRLIRGDVVFAESALSAVRSYVYKPTYLDDQAAEVVSEVTVEFNLAKAELGMKN